MRALTKKQKNFLDKWYNTHKKEIGLFTDIYDLMTLEEIKQLEEMNDTEVLFQNINTYIKDKVMR